MNDDSIVNSNGPESESLLQRLGLNRRVIALLISMGALGLAEEVWRNFLPLYLNVKLDDVARTVGYVGVFACLVNLLEGFAYILGGTLCHRLGPRIALAAAALPMVCGFALMLYSSEPWIVVLGALLMTNWEPISVPATFEVVGGEVPKERRTVAFAVQSIQKRVPKVLGPLVGTATFAAIGYWLNLSIAFGMLVISALVLAFLSRDMREKKKKGPEIPAGVILRGMSKELRLLLSAEILIRWGDWFVRDFASLYVVYTLGVPKGDWGIFPALTSLVALITYIPVGKLIDKSRSPKPYIGLTFFLFALFPFCLVLLPKTGLPVMAALAITFIVNGLRELGEPARKAFITAAFPPECRARGVGLYWGIRSFAFCPAPLLAWLAWEHFGPEKTFLLGGGVGMVGTAWYWIQIRWSERARRQPPVLAEAKLQDGAGMVRDEARR